MRISCTAFALLIRYAAAGDPSTTPEPGEFAPAGDVQQAGDAVRAEVTPEPVPVASLRKPKGRTLSPHQGACPCNKFGCGATDDCDRFEQSYQALVSIERGIVSGRYPAGTLPPFIGGGRKRHDVCPLGTLILLDHLSTDATVKTFVAQVSSEDPFYGEPVPAAPVRGDRKRRATQAVEQLVPRVKRGRLEEGDKVPSGISELSSSTTMAPVAERVMVLYGDDCRQRLSVSAADRSSVRHPFDMNYIFMAFLAEAGVAVQPFYLSPLVVVARPVETTRIMSNTLEDRLDECIAAGATVRFIVHAETGPSLKEYSQWMADQEELANSAEMSKRILKLIRKAVDKLQIMHDLGIMHGALHDQSIVLKRPVGSMEDVDVDDDEVVFANFQVGSFFGGSLKEPVKRVNPWVYHVRYMSKWGLDGEREGPRDDIFHLLLMAAQSLSRGHLSRAVDTMLESNVKAAGEPEEGTPAHTRVAKEVMKLIYGTLPWFDYSVAMGTGAFVRTAIPPALVRSLRAKLEAIVEHVRSYSHPNWRPMYADIKRGLDDVIAAL